jgi:hypothetical protein
MTDEDAAGPSICRPGSLFAGYISEEEYARQRGVSVRTCQRDRALRKSPPHCVLGKQIFYRIESVRAWLLQQERSFKPSQSRAASGQGRL